MFFFFVIFDTKIHQLICGIRFLKKYIKSIDFLSENFVDTDWIPPKEYLEKWHSDYIIII